MEKRFIGVGFIVHLSNSNGSVLGGLKLNDPHFTIFGSYDEEKADKPSIVHYSNVTDNVKTSSSYLIVKILFDENKISVDHIRNFSSMKSKMLYQIPVKTGEIAFDREFESYAFMHIKGNIDYLGFYDPRDDEITEDNSSFDMNKLKPVEWFS